MSRSDTYPDCSSRIYGSPNGAPSAKKSGQTPGFIANGTPISNDSSGTKKNQTLHDSALCARGTSSLVREVVFQPSAESRRFEDTGNVGRDQRSANNIVEGVQIFGTTHVRLWVGERYTFTIHESGGRQWIRVQLSKQKVAISSSTATVPIGPTPRIRGGVEIPRAEPHKVHRDCQSMNTPPSAQSGYLATALRDPKNGTTRRAEASATRAQAGQSNGTLTE
ncbi:hypothetical protein EVAR_50685_1 [Eumeta japonica]|uniref:Uncharacterized protein n=1 Tax=Eumeta variegata TaxID=151549 RepID=A0A4C1XMJ4_EUMVA|nr:hypothetical protein EVAR_50685_1 [Eumeta japonica]